MIRGLDSRQEVDPGLLLRDTRTMGKRIQDFFQDATNASVLLVMLAIAAFLLPAIADVMFLIGMCCYAYSVTRQRVLPFRLPQRSKMLDYNDIKPGTEKPNQARGIAFFGNDAKTNEELWFTNDDMRTHVLMFGSTGSGKTEALVSIAYNALVQASGFIYVDGKGDNSLFAKIFSMARSMGREDDLLLVNFMTGARDIIGPQEKRLSNTMNPFSSGSSSMLAQLVISLMESSSQSSDGDMWKGRAITFVESLMKLLVYMRDQGHILLDANSIRNYFHLERLESIVMDQQFPRDEQEPVSLQEVPDLVMEPIRNYVFNLPGYNKERKGKQVSQVLEQHGFITMQLTRVFTSLADTYGHIIRTNLPEIDFKDVVLNRRILVVLLPALEKSPDELSNLGKVIVSSLKAMMAAGLGEEVEGSYHDVVERKPTNAPTPYMCILDEYGYYAVQGFAVVPAQARSLGFSAIFAGQDLPAFQKASKEEAASIGANTNIKICMKLEDPVDTWEFFTKTAGEAYVTKVDSFQTKETSVTNSYMDTKSASFEKRARIDLLDLKEQREGEAHIFFRSRIVRAKMFYANPAPVKYLRINHFLRVAAPPERQLVELEKRTAQFENIIASGNLFEGIDAQIQNEEVNFIVESLAEHAELEPIDRGVTTLLAYHKLQEPEEVVEEPEVLSEIELNIFTPMRLSEPLMAVLLADDRETFAQALLDAAPTQKQLLSIERLSGSPGKQAGNIANEIVKDMRLATHYPPHQRDTLDEAGLVDVVHSLCSAIQEARIKSQSTGGEGDADTASSVD